MGLGGMDAAYSTWLLQFYQYCDIYSLHTGVSRITMPHHF